MWQGLGDYSWVTWGHLGCFQPASFLGFLSSGSISPQHVANYTLLKPFCRLPGTKRGLGVSQNCLFVEARKLVLLGALTAHLPFFDVSKRKGQGFQWRVWWQTTPRGSGRSVSRITTSPTPEQPPLTWNPQAHRVTDARFEFVRVEPGLREAATEAGIDGFTQQRWQLLWVGKQNSGNILDISRPRKELRTAERVCDKTLYLIQHCLPPREREQFPSAAGPHCAGLLTLPGDHT